MNASTQPAARGVDLGRCPRCSTALVTVHQAEPWCGQCEWNLDCFDPARPAPDFGWRWLDRWAFRLAFRWTDRQFGRLAGRTVERPGLTHARIVTVTASVVLLAILLALAALAVWMIVYDFPSPMILPGALLLLVVAVLRPRFGRLGADAEGLNRESAPALFDLVDRVAAAIGAPSPHVVAIDAAYNAYTGSVGVRRRRVLCLGLPLWGALSPGQRVALLGHELGHFVNGDVRRGLFTQPAFTTLAVAASITRPVHERADGIGALAVRFAQVVLWLVSGTLRTLHLLLVSVALRDGQQAEYLADEMSVMVAGTEAAAELADVLVTDEAGIMLVRQSARNGGGAEQWRDAVQRSMEGATARLPLLRQLSIRDRASLFASHPPSGLRARMIRARPQRNPVVSLTEAESRRIDAELARHYARIGRDIAWGG